jgi:hypothetical protein
MSVCCRTDAARGRFGFVGIAAWPPAWRMQRLRPDEKNARDGLGVPGKVQKVPEVG